MEKHYTPKTWKNSPNTDSPINEYWLNHIEAGINENDNRSVLLDANKLDKSAAQKYVKSVTLDKKTGVLTVTLVDGTKTSTDLDIEKVVTNFDLDENNNLVLTLADGTKKTVPLSKFIDTYTFKSSTTVSFSANGKEITAIIPDGAVTLEKLEASVITTIRKYTLDAQTAKGQAEQAAQTAGGWAIGGVEGFETNNSKYFANKSKRYAVGGVEEGDTTDNAKHYCEEARKAADQVTKLNSDLDNNKIKSLKFTATSNSGGGFLINGAVENDRWIAVVSTTGDHMYLLLGNGYILIVKNVSNVITPQPTTETSGILYYI